jgi:RNA polymerase sigma-70 factor (ECF subfamily)
VTPFTADQLEVAVLRARTGEEEGVRVLYRWLHPRLLRYLRHHVGNEAEDVAAESWLTVARLMPRFEGGAAEFRALLFAVSRRRVVDHHRRNGRTVKSAQVGQLYDLEQADTEHGTEPTETIVLDNLTAQHAVDLLASSLSPEQAEVVLLRVVADLSVEEVARMLGKAPAAIRAAQYRAIRKLQQTLERGSVTL